MRTTIICGAGMVAGKEIMALELGGGLRDAGLPVDYLTSHWGDGDFRARLEKSGFEKQCLWLGFISATLTKEALLMTWGQMVRMPALWLAYGWFLRKHPSRRLLHTNWHHLLLLAPFLRPGRDFFWLHEVLPNRVQFRRVFGWLARRVSCFVAVSEAVAESLRQIGIPEQKIRVIRNGLSDPVPAAALERAPSEEVRIGIVGQIGAWKGHEDLLEAFAQVSARHPHARLYLFGSANGPFALELKARAESLGVAAQVFFQGFIAERSEIYRQLDICVVPSRKPDPLPTVAIEAAFFGLPVVATLSGGLPEIVVESRTGFLVAVQNPGQLAEALDKLLASATLRKTMGRAAREHALERFGRERFVRAFLSLLQGAA